MCFASFFLKKHFSLFPQARQILEREYNNLLALGTDRRLDEVSSTVTHGSDVTPPWGETPPRRWFKMFYELEDDKDVCTINAPTA